MKIDVRTNMREVQLALDVAQKDISKAAASSAINKVAITVRAEASKKIRETYNIKASTAKDQIAVKKATAAFPSATITATGSRLPLIEFAARQNKVGVSVKVKTAGPRKTIAHAFIVTTRKGIKSVFIRKGASRYPLKFLTSVGIAQAFAAKVVMGALEKIVKDRFPIVYKQELQFRLNRAGQVLRVKG